MRLDLGCPVRCTDDAFGELADVVIHTQPDRYYDGMPSEEGGKVHEREIAPNGHPEE